MNGKAYSAKKKNGHSLQCWVVIVGLERCLKVLISRGTVPIRCLDRFYIVVKYSSIQCKLMQRFNPIIAHSADGSKVLKRHTKRVQSSDEGGLTVATV